MDERRKTVQLINYWKKVKCNDQMPIIESFEIQSFSNRLLNSIIILTSTSNHPHGYHIEFIGKNIIDMNRIIDDSLTSPFTKILNKISIIAKKSALVIDQGSFNDVDQNLHKYRSCLMPFGQSSITHFVICISYSD